METTLTRWRSEGRRVILDNFGTFRGIVAEARRFAARRRYDEAALHACAAAYHAQHRHCGLFVSAELEQLLVAIGEAALGDGPRRPDPARLLREPHDVLHVATNVSVYSGSPRFVRRWIQHDSDRSHSLALTKQAPDEIPPILQERVVARRGNIHVLNRVRGGLLARARRLRQIASTADVVVLHAWEQDVVPLLAFGSWKSRPRVIYVNHGDHWFWLGAAIADVVVNLRHSGMILSQQRRGIEPQRNLLLPTILEPLERTLSRAEAKRRIDLPPDAPLLLSIARPAKYKTVDGVTFADAHVPLLRRHPRALLMVIGPGHREDWVPAMREAQGRIRVLGQTEDTAVFYQAADIYVDSFPFVSNTSLLEAGCYGVPLVSRYPYTDGCEILGADTPGFAATLVRARDLEDYTRVLSRLIDDEPYRVALGDATKRAVDETHRGPKWQLMLTDVYRRCATMPRVSEIPAPPRQMWSGEPDVYLPFVHGGFFNPDWVVDRYLGVLPLTQRLRHWARLGEQNGRRLPYSCLLPEWLCLRYLDVREFVQAGGRDGAAAPR